MAIKRWVKGGLRTGLLLGASYLPHAAAQTQPPVITPPQGVIQPAEAEKRNVILKAKEEYPDLTLLEIMHGAAQDYAKIARALDLEPGSTHTELVKQDFAAQEIFQNISLKELDLSNNTSVNSGLEAVWTEKLDELTRKYAIQFRDEGLTYGQAMQRVAGSTALQDKLDFSFLESMKGYGNPALTEQVNAVPMKLLYDEKGEYSPDSMAKDFIPKLPLTVAMHPTMSKELKYYLSPFHQKALPVVQAFFRTNMPGLEEKEPLQSYLNKHNMDYFLSPLLVGNGPEIVRIQKEYADTVVAAKIEMARECIQQWGKSDITVLKLFEGLHENHPVRDTLAAYPPFRLAKELSALNQDTAKKFLEPKQLSLLHKLDVPVKELIKGDKLLLDVINGWSWAISNGLKDEKLIDFKFADNKSDARNQFYFNIKTAIIDVEPNLDALFYGAKNGNEKCKRALEETRLKDVLVEDSLYLDPGKIASFVEKTFPAVERAALAIKRPNGWEKLKAPGSDTTIIPHSFSMQHNARLKTNTSTNTAEMTEEQRAILRYAMTQYSRFLPIEFPEVNTLPSQQGNATGILFHNGTLPQDWAGVAYGFGTSHLDVVVDMKKADHERNKLELLDTYLHELAHAVGLNHPHDAGEKLPGTRNDAVPGINKLHSIVSYTRLPGVHHTTASTADVHALREMLGARLVNTGNTTYTLREHGTIEEILKNPHSNTVWTGFAQTLVDDGGTNYLDARQVKDTLNLDMSAPVNKDIIKNTHLGMVGTMHHVTAGYGVIIGNEQNNRIETTQGGIIDGKKGDDTLVSGHKGTRMHGGEGNDTFQIQAGHGKDAIEDYQPGHDKIVSPNGTSEICAVKKDGNNVQLLFYNKEGNVLKTVNLTSDQPIEKPGEITVQDVNGKTQSLTQRGFSSRINPSKRGTLPAR